MDIKRVLFCLLGFSLMAGMVAEGQVKRIDDATFPDAGGIKKLPMMPMFYTYYYHMHGEQLEHAPFIIELLNDTLGTINRIEMEPGKVSKVVSVGTNEQTFLLVSLDEKENTRNYTITNEQGTVLGSKEEEDIHEILYSPEYYPVAFSPMPEQYMLVVPLFDEKPGYKIWVVDREFNERSSKSFFPDQGSWQIEKIFSADQFVFVLRKEMKGQEKLSFVLHGIDMMSGETIFESPIYGEEDGLAYPSFFSARHGMINYGGELFSGSKASSKSEGLFFNMAGSSGDVQLSIVLPWDSIKKHLPGSYAAGLGKDKKLIPVGGINAGEQKILITEGFERARRQGSGNSEFVRKDLVLFYFDDMGGLAKAEIIGYDAKPATVIGPMADKEEIAVANWLNKKGFFAYEAIVNVMGYEYLMYEQETEMGPQLNFYALDTMAENTPTPIALIADEQGEEGRKRKKEKSYKTIKADVFHSTPGYREEVVEGELSFDAMPLEGGKVLIYNKTSRVYKAWVQRIVPLKTAENEGAGK